MKPQRLASDRTKQVVKAGEFGICVNLLLSLFKALVGFSAGSIAVILDAINNATDAVSGVVTIAGTKLANKRPDAKHPYGYGRIEYMASLIIAALIVYAGVSALIESIKKILHPTVASYTAPTLAVIVVAICIKFAMMLYFKHVGTATSSHALLVSSTDAKTDVFLTSGTLLAALLAIFFNLDIDGIVGAIISVGIVHEGIVSVRESVGPVIGDAVDPQFAASFKEFVMSYPQVEGVFDLSVDDYGPTKTLAACHIEVPDTLTAREIHELCRHITKDAFEKYRILLTIGIYATNSINNFAEEKERILSIVYSHKSVKNVHALYIDPSSHFIDFDVVLDFKANAKAVRKALLKDLEQVFPEYKFSIVEDVDYSA